MRLKPSTPRPAIQAVASRQSCECGDEIQLHERRQHLSIYWADSGAKHFLQVDSAGGVVLTAPPAPSALPSEAADRCSQWASTRLSRWSTTDALGPWENSNDRADGTTIGRYTSTVGAMDDKYMKPQSAGSRGELREVAFTDPATGYCSFRPKAP